MAASVRIFGHSGVQQIPVVRPMQFASDAIYQLEQPYLFRETLTAGGAAVSSTPVADSKTRLLWVEVEDGKTIRYEINPPGRNVPADGNSPSLSGKNLFYFRDSFTISVIEAV